MSSMTSSTSPTPDPSAPAAAPGTAAATNVGTLEYKKPATPPVRVPLFTADAWAPLKVELFRSLWIATSIAQIGTWAREAAGPALMESLTRGWHTQPVMVARVLAFSNLPICLFSVFAGALADVLDRRRLLIVTQIWMVLISAVLGIFTICGMISPAGLLGLTFLLGVGTAAFGPALQAVLPELVPKQHFALAINMNSVALNVARAVGPALFILVVQFVPGDRGAGVAYLLTAASFVAAGWALWRWERPPQRAGLHGEEIWDGIRAGFRYTVHSPANRAILLRVFTFIVPALVLWAQVPIIATRQLHMTSRPEQATAMVFTFVGLGAILGVFLMPGLHGRYKIDPVVNACTGLFAIGLIALSLVHTMWIAWFILMFLGLNWVIVPTNFNTATQKSVPLWVKGRAISFYLTVLFGSFTIGSILWGRVTTQTSISTALLLGGVSMAALLVLAVWFPLTLNEGLDLSPAAAAAVGAQPTGPDIAPPIDPNAGPIPPDVTGPLDFAVEYRVPPHRADEFHSLMHRVRQQRRRSGAARWRLERIEESEGVRFIERYRFQTATEYHRHPARMTRADQTFIESVHAYHAGEQAPTPRRADPADWPTARQVLGTRFLAQMEISFNRTLDEIEAIADRVANLHDRDRTRWRGIRITIEVPGREEVAEKTGE
jgi:predicted MFS family arabinose efflux permease